jgi:hypothetical protein
MLPCPDGSRLFAGKGGHRATKPATTIRLLRRTILLIELRDSKKLKIIVDVPSYYQNSPDPPSINITFIELHTM